MRVGFIGLGSQGGPMARRIVEGGYDTDAVGAQTRHARAVRRHRREDRWITRRTGRRQRPGLPVRGRRRRRQRGTDRRHRRAGRIGVRRDRRHPQHRASRHLPRGRRIRCRTGCFGHRRTGERRRARRRGGHAAGHGRRRGGVVERCRPVFATYADPIVHLGPLGSGQVTKILNNLLFTANLGSAISTLELGESLGIHRDRLCEVLTGGSATSKALGSIAVFGGTLEGLAPIAGALLQKDVRHAASIADAASAPQGAVFDAADAALNVDGPPAMTRVGIRRRRAAWARRWCAASSRPATRSASRPHTPRSAQRSANWVHSRSPISPTSAEDAEAVVVCVFTDDQVAAGLPATTAWSPPCARGGRSSSTPRAARAPPRPSPPARVHRRDRRAGQRRPARHRRRPR